VWEAVAGLIEGGIEIHCLRDLTRGGLASALNEIAKVRGISMQVNEAAVPVLEPVRGACELLGLDPLYVANEGRFVAFVPAPQADRALSALRRCEVSGGSVRIGDVIASDPPMVTLRSRIGGNRILDMLSGEQLPRIC
jgi:hydrogenase expression/formation protein HypE